MYDELKNPDVTCKGLFETGKSMLSCLRDSNCIFSNSCRFWRVLDLPYVRNEMLILVL